MTQNRPIILRRSTIVLLVSLIFIANVYSVRAAEVCSEGCSEQFRLEQGATRYYVTTLDVNETWKIDVTSVYEGIFEIYLYSERITEYTYQYEAVASNNSGIKIFSTSLNDTVNFVSANYTAKVKQMYYLEIVLVKNGPDTFVLKSSHSVQTYFIPFIPGYPIEIIMICGVFTIFILIRKFRKN
jgi:hypothetical protein